MTILALVDTETGGLDPAQHRVIEVACVLWSVPERTILDVWSALIRDEENPAEPINRIPVAALAHGTDRAKVLAALVRMVSRADIWLAHRLEFDASFLPDMGRPGVCTKFDVRWPLSSVGDSLVTVALAHGVAITHAHRALSDALTMARVFERVAELGHDVPAMLAKAMRPRALFEVSDTRFDAERNAAAKAAGFAWYPDVRAWRGKVALEDADSLPFAVREVVP